MQIIFTLLLVLCTSLSGSDAQTYLCPSYMVTRNNSSSPLSLTLDSRFTVNPLTIGLDRNCDTLVVDTAPGTVFNSKITFQSNVGNFFDYRSFTVRLRHVVFKDDVSFTLGNGIKMILEMDNVTTEKNFVFHVFQATDPESYVTITNCKFTRVGRPRAQRDFNVDFFKWLVLFESFEDQVPTTTHLRYFRVTGNSWRCENDVYPVGQAGLRYERAFPEFSLEGMRIAQDVTVSQNSVSCLNCGGAGLTVSLNAAWTNSNDITLPGTAANAKLQGLYGIHGAGLFIQNNIVTLQCTEPMPADYDGNPIYARCAATDGIRVSHVGLIADSATVTGNRIQVSSAGDASGMRFFMDKAGQAINATCSGIRVSTISGNRVTVEGRSAIGITFRTIGNSIVEDNVVTVSTQQNSNIPATYRSTDPIAGINVLYSCTTWERRNFPFYYSAQRCATCIGPGRSGEQQTTLSNADASNPLAFYMFSHSYNRNKVTVTCTGPGSQAATHVTGIGVSGVAVIAEAVSKSFFTIVFNVSASSNNVVLLTDSPALHAASGIALTDMNSAMPTERVKQVEDLKKQNSGNPAFEMLDISKLGLPAGLACAITGTVNFVNNDITVDVQARGYGDVLFNDDWQPSFVSCGVCGLSGFPAGMQEIVGKALSIMQYRGVSLSNINVNDISTVTNLINSVNEMQNPLLPSFPSSGNFFAKFEKNRVNMTCGGTSPAPCFAAYIMTRESGAGIEALLTGNDLLVTEQRQSSGAGNKYCGTTGDNKKYVDPATSIVPAVVAIDAMMQSPAGQDSPLTVWMRGTKAKFDIIRPGYQVCREWLANRAAVFTWRSTNTRTRPSIYVSGGELSMNVSEPYLVNAFVRLPTSTSIAPLNGPFTLQINGGATGGDLTTFYAKSLTECPDFKCRLRRYLPSVIGQPLPTALPPATLINISGIHFAGDIAVADSEQRFRMCPKIFENDPSFIAVPSCGGGVIGTTAAPPSSVTAPTQPAAKNCVLGVRCLLERCEKRLTGVDAEAWSAAGWAVQPFDEEICVVKTPSLTLDPACSTSALELRCSVIPYNGKDQGTVSLVECSFRKPKKPTEGDDGGGDDQQQQGSNNSSNATSSTSPPDDSNSEPPATQAPDGETPYGRDDQGLPIYAGFSSLAETVPGAVTVRLADSSANVAFEIVSVSVRRLNSVAHVLVRPPRGVDKIMSAVGGFLAFSEDALTCRLEKSVAAAAAPPSKTNSTDAATTQKKQQQQQAAAAEAEQQQQQRVWLSDDVLLPRPFSFVPAAAVQAGMGTLTAATFLVGLLGGSGGIMASLAARRFMTSARIFECSPDDAAAEQLDPYDHPLQFDISGSYAMGAMVGNFVIVVGFGLLVLILFKYRQYSLKHGGAGGDDGGGGGDDDGFGVVGFVSGGSTAAMATKSEALLWAGWPDINFSVSVLFVHGQLLALTQAIALLVKGRAALYGGAAAHIAVMVCCVLPVFYPIYIVFRAVFPPALFKSRARAVPAHLIASNKKGKKGGDDDDGAAGASAACRQVLLPWVTHGYRWRDLIRGSKFVERYCSAFEDCGPSSYLASYAELLLTAILAILEGIPEPTGSRSCNAIALLRMMVAACSFILAILRPYCVKLLNWHAILVNILGVTSLLLQVAARYKGGDQTTMVELGDLCIFIIFWLSLFPVMWMVASYVIEPSLKMKRLKKIVRSICGGGGKGNRDDDDKETPLNNGGRALQPGELLVQQQKEREMLRLQRERERQARRGAAAGAGGGSRRRRLADLDDDNDDGAAEEMLGRSARGRRWQQRSFSPHELSAAERDRIRRSSLYQRYSKRVATEVAPEVFVASRRSASALV